MPNDEEETPMLLSLRCQVGSELERQIDTLNEWIGLGADVNHIDASGHSILADAILKKIGIDVISTLVDCEADVNHVDAEGVSMLEIAVGTPRSVSIIRKLINGRTIGMKAEGGASAFPQDTLDVGAKTMGADLRRLNNYGQSFLHIAAHKGTLECLKFFLDLRGLDVNGKDINGQTVLMHAKRSPVDPVKKCKLLVGSSANLKLLSNHNRSVLHHAACDGNLQTLKYLLGLELDVMGRDIDGNTPLHHALLDEKLYKKEKCYLLIEHGAGADLNVSNEAGETPLWLSLRIEKNPPTYGYLYFLRQFVKLGADVNYVNSKDEFEDSVLGMTIRKKCSTDLIKCLIARGADVSHVNRSGDSILKLAVEKKIDIDVVRKLLKDRSGASTVARTILELDDGVLKTDNLTDAGIIELLGNYGVTIQTRRVNHSSPSNKGKGAAPNNN